MKVLLLGGGGREAALAWRLAQSTRLTQLWVSHENPGFPEGARKIPEGDVAAVAAQLGIDLVVVGPEAPLAEGVVDACRSRGILAFGPTRAAAMLESSKRFAKDFMARHGIATASYQCFRDRESALAAINGPCVVKADGLAAGKGVYVCADSDEAHSAVEALFAGAHGEAGAEVVVESLLVGEEVSVLALCDGERFSLLPPAQDHKRRFDGDRGPNTGGMGAYAPAPVMTAGLQAQVGREVIAKVLAGMAAEGSPFTGVLYAGLMICEEGPQVLEFNCRFGDPECQPLMMLLREDLLELLLSCAAGKLEPRPLAVRDGAACCVVMASKGYPGPVEKGFPISGLTPGSEDVVVFQAGTTRGPGGEVRTDGGRVLGVTAWGSDIQSATQRAYEAVENIHFEGATWRKDIAWRALEARS